MKKVNVIKRKKCVVCTSSKLETVYTIKNFPVYMGIANQEIKKDLVSDMVFSKCVKCNCIQMRNLIPLEVLYKKNHAGSVGPTWLAHHRSFAKFVLKHASGNIVEVGGAHLTLANLIEKDKAIDSVTVYDANIIGEPASHKVQTVEGLFNSTTAGKKPDAIVHSHVIEHLYEPMKEIREMSALLEEGGTMIISAPVIDKMMEDGFTNAMNFEHTYGLTKNLIYEILENANLKVIDQEYFNKHCIFIAAIKENKCSTYTFNYQEDSSYFDKFIMDKKNESKEINQCLASFKSNQDVFVFGAHIFTQFLIKNGLDEEIISCVLDNDIKKQGNRLYGTNLMVKSPKILKKIKKPIVILKAGQYTEEIKKDIIENINKDTRFVL